MESAQHFHSASVEGTARIVSSIKGKEEFSVLEHTAVVVKAQTKLRKHQTDRARPKEHTTVVVKVKAKLRKHRMNRVRPKEARDSPRADGHHDQTCCHESSEWKDIWLAQCTAHSTPSHSWLTNIQNIAILL